MNKRSNYDEEFKEIVELRNRGFKINEISEIMGIPRGTISCRLSRAKRKGLIDIEDGRKNNGAKPKEKNPMPEVKVVVQEKTLKDFQPRDMIKHLYNLGYRIKDNELYVMTLQKVNLQSVINE